MNKSILRSLLFALAGVFALGLRAQAEDHPFYIGETGYDNWAAAMNAASVGGTVSLGTDAEISGNQMKSLTIDLRGHTLTANTSNAPYIADVTSISVTDSAGGGLFTAPNGMNLQGTIDLSALTHDQFSIAGNRFWTGSDTVAKFPAGWTLDECKAKFRNSVAGAKIVAQGVTYTCNGSSWVSDAPGHDITITAPQNGTLETSVTNDVAAGTIVTVTATPAAGYLFASVTTNGAVLAGMTFEMPSEDVTVAATFDDQESPTRMFYIGGTGYDSWTAAYNAAQNGATITVGVNAEISGTVGSKTFTLDLCGRSVNIISGWWYGTVTVIDSAAPAGRFVVVPENGGNFSQSKVDFSALASTQVSGKFQLTDASSIMTFPGDRSFEDCTSAVTGKSAGTRIVVQGVTYTWSGSSWQASNPVIGSFHITPLKTKATVSGSITDAGTDATACDVYFALDGGAAAKIAEGATGSFEYRITDLTAGTTYAYVLSVSNNAPTAKGTVRSGTFTTLAADASTLIWTTSEGVPGDFSPLADNLISNKTGIAAGGDLSGYGGGVDLLTDGEVSDVTTQTCGFRENMTVEWSFDAPKSLETIRFTTCYTAGNGWYDDIKISKVEVKTSGSDSWTDLGAETLDYAGSGTAGTALFATLADAETGFLAQDATALRITFGKPNNVAQYYAEIEAVGHAVAEKDVLVIAIQ